MEAIEHRQDIIKGAEFSVKEKDPESIFTLEDYTEEQKLLRENLRDFIKKEIEPVKAALMVAGLRQLTDLSPFNFKKCRREIASYFIQKNKYQL